MEHWDLTGLDIEPHRPQILASKRGESRAIALFLPAGEELQEHQVHERAHLVVIEGEVEIGRDGGEAVSGGPGKLAIFEPGERHWHGASASVGMTHMAVQASQGGSPVTWLEPVSDADYGA